MRVGDLVVYRNHSEYAPPQRAGVVTKIHTWVDQGAPDRNFGVDVWVLWPDGSHDPCDEHELEVVSEARHHG